MEHPTAIPNHAVSDPTNSVPVNDSTQSVVLSQEQETAIEVALNRDPSENVLIIGKAGVGKSTTTRELLRRANDRGMNFLHCAPTGVAAINIGGFTVHRLISRLASFVEPGVVIDGLLIDEASMLRADLFDQLDKALRAKMFNTKPFGGVKIVLVGDPGQLPPVVKDGDTESDYVKDNYLTPFFWSANCYHQTKWHVVELTKVFRQKDQKYPNMLNMIRRGDFKRPVEWLNKYRTTTQPKGVILTSTNKAAEALNQEQLSRLQGPTMQHQAMISGRIETNEYPTDYLVILKPGARVMVIKNIYQEPEFPGGPSALELVNGDVGTVIDFDEQAKTAIIRCDRTQQEHIVGRALWEKEDVVYDRKTRTLQRQVIGTFVQLPLRLAWAVTIHKSQGATIEELTIDVRRPLFAPGQAYVALSRGVTLEKLWILGNIRPKDIIVSPEVSAFLTQEPLFTHGVGIKKGSIFDGTQMTMFDSESTAIGANDLVGMDAEDFA